MSEQTATAAPVNACNHWVLAVSASDVRSGRSLHGMQGVSGSNPLGSILSDSLRRKGSFLLLRVSLAGPAGPKSAKTSENCGK